MLESDSVPNINDIVFSSWENDRKIGMEAHCWNVVRVAIFIKGIKALLGLIVPHLYMAVITTRYQVRAIKGWAEINAIYTCLMTYKRVVSTGFSRSSFSWSWNGPNLDSSIERSTRKHVWVLGIDSHLHNVMFMILVRINLLPILVPIYQLDCLIIRATYNIWKCRMDCKVSNEVSVLINYLQFFTCVVVVYTNLCIISSDNDPLLSRDELSASHWSIGNFEGSHLWLLVVIKYDHSASIQTDEDPGQSGMKFDALDTLRPAEQLFLDFKLHFLYIIPLVFKLYINLIRKIQRN